jgi:hypothetical protein
MTRCDTKIMLDDNSICFCFFQWPRSLVWPKVWSCWPWDTCLFFVSSTWIQSFSWPAAWTTLRNVCAKTPRPILNFAPRGKLWPQGQSCPPVVNFVPLSWSYPLGVKFFVRPSILLHSSVHPWGWTKGWTFPLGDKWHPWGQFLREFAPTRRVCAYTTVAPRREVGAYASFKKQWPLGARGEVKNGPLILFFESIVDCDCFP